MENINTPEFYADKLAKIYAPLDEKRQEMKETLKEFRKMFNALKVKIKKYEKIIAALDETNDKLLIMVATNNAQMAINKFEGTEKRIERCRQQQKYFEEYYKELPKYLHNKDSYLDYMIDRVKRCHSDFNNSIHEGEDMIRIAKKHLKKSDDFFASHRRMWKGYRVR